MPGNFLNSRSLFSSKRYFFSSPKNNCTIKEQSNLVVTTTNRKALPKLIFAENHWDPSTVHALNLLARILGPIGYRFYDEARKSYTLEQHMKDNLEQIKAYRELKAQFDEMHLDLYNDTDILKYVLSKIGNRSDQIEIYSVAKELKDFIGRSQTQEQCKKFLETLKEHNIPYQGIDVERNVFDLFPSNFNPNLTQLRDSQMAEMYRNSRYPVFGRIGLIHAQGIQNALEKFSYEIAKANYCFFHLFNSKSISFASHFERQMRDNKINYPLGLISINVSSTSDAGIIEQVMEQMQIKADMMQKHIEDDVDDVECDYKTGMANS